MSNPQSRERTRLRWRLFAASTACFGTLAAVEVVWRFAVAPPVNIRFATETAGLQSAGMTTAAQILVNDPDRFWKLRADTVVSRREWPYFGRIANRQGLRSDYEIVLPKPDGCTRILFLGDSCTFGEGLDLSETYTIRTQRLLEERAPELSPECINGGVPGYTLFQGMRLLETEGFALQPDLVVLCFGWNDMKIWDGLSDMQHHQRTHDARPPGLLKHSRLATSLWPAFAASASSKFKRPRLRPEEYRGLLEHIHSACQERSIRLTVLVWPAMVQIESDPAARTPMQLATYEFAEARKVPLVDLIPVVQAAAHEHEIRELYFDGIHATAIANAAIAEAVAEALLKQLTQASRTP